MANNVRKKALDQSNPLWERQPGESKRSYDAFLEYRDMEHRDLKFVPNGWQRSFEWSWTLRVRAWDDYLTKMEDESLIRYRLKMNERQRAIARLAQTKAAEWLQSLTPGTIAKMKASEVARLLEVATKIEREAAKGSDDADVTLDMRVTHDLALSEEEAAERLRTLMAEVEGRLALENVVDVEVVEDEVGD